MMGMNAWLWSAVFHARDWRSTELLDYFSADLFVVGTLASTICRVFQLRSRSSLGLVWGCLILLYLRHVHQMMTVSFDYGYNTLAAIALGGVGSLLWLWSLLRHRPPYAWKVAACHMGMWAAASFEVWDFPPVFGLIDAHSLWHLSTVPLGFLWYSFLEDDLRAATKLRSHREASKLT